MNALQKTLTVTAWCLAVAGMILFLGLYAKVRQSAAAPIGSAEMLPITYDSPTFSLLDQQSHRVTDQTLRGQPYIGDFIFTSCASACPLMSAKMSQLQGELTGADVKLVSFSVDPRTDRPDVMAGYAKGYGADFHRWLFLTGETTGQMFDLIHAMKLPGAPADGTNAILHSEKFVLVDADGKIRAFYDSNDPAQVKDLLADARRLAGAPPNSPASAAADAEGSHP